MAGQLIRTTYKAIILKQKAQRIRQTCNQSGIIKVRLFIKKILRQSGLVF